MTGVQTCALPISGSSDNKNLKSSKEYKIIYKDKKINKQNIIKFTPKKAKYPIEENEEYNYINKNTKTKKNRNDKKIENEDDDLVTSFERKPSELKSPETFSKDSFINSYEEKKELSKNDGDKYNENRNNKKNNDEEKNDSYSDSELEENEFIYIDRINNNKDDEFEKNKKNNKKKNNNKENDDYKKLNKKNNINKTDIDEMEKDLIEKKLKERDKNNKKEKFKNKEIKAKNTTKLSQYVTNLNSNTYNKIKVNKNQKEINLRLEKEFSSDINNMKKLNINNFDEKGLYIPVNRRKKLIVNKLNLKIKDFSKTNILNFLENDKPMLVTNKTFGKTRTNTEGKGRYRKKFIKQNYFKEIGNNTNINKLNLENLRNYRTSISLRKQKELKNNFKFQMSNNLSQTIKISKGFNIKKDNKDKDKEISNDKLNLIKKKNNFSLKKILS